MPNMLKILPRAALNEDVQSALSPVVIANVSRPKAKRSREQL